MFAPKITFSECHSGSKTSYSLLETSDSGGAFINNAAHYDFFWRFVAMETAVIGGALIVVSNFYNGASSRILYSAECALGGESNLLGVKFGRKTLFTQAQSPEQCSSESTRACLAGRRLGRALFGPRLG